MPTALRPILRLLVLALFLGSLRSAQAAGPADFADVRWGVSIVEARKIMTARPEVKFVSETPELLTFSGGTFGGIPVKTWKLHFKDGKFHKGKAELVRASGKSAKGLINDQIYDSTVRALNTKYGKSVRHGNNDYAQQIWDLRASPTMNAPTKIEFLYQFRGDERFEITYSYGAVAGAAAAKDVPKPKRDDF